ncbi:MAG: peptidylprolyl isomerase [Limnobacter sp.]|nr:peptidylprolyl isomerase [Limnobacter sp.]
MNAPAVAQNAAVVNGKPVPSGLLDYIVAEQIKRGAPQTPEIRDTIRRELVNQEILKQEAIKKGLASTETVQYQMQMMNQAILSNALREDFLAKNEVSESDLQEAYNNIAKMMGGQEYHASHILVEKEEQAKALIDKLNKGASFAELAKANSKDPGSARNGGDLDWANPNSFVPEFSQAMVQLEKGKYTKQPVKSQFGYHIILVNDVRTSTPPALDTVKDQLKEGLLAQKWEKYQADLLSNAKVQ